MQNDVCSIPVTATVKIIDGEAVITKAEYVDIPASVIAEFILSKYGIDAILERGEDVH